MLDKVNSYLEQIPSCIMSLKSLSICLPLYINPIGIICLLLPSIIFIFLFKVSIIFLAPKWMDVIEGGKDQHYQWRYYVMVHLCFYIYLFSIG